MKPLSILCLISILFISASHAQSFEELSYKENQQKKIGMSVLGVWSFSNIIVSPILAYTSSGSERYFYAMNGYWNTVNLALSVSGLHAVRKYDAKNSSLLDEFNDHRQIQTIFLVNGMLDVSYMVTGLYLIEKSKTMQNKTERLEGFGKSLILQGAFLFVFDGFMFSVFKANDAKWMRFFENLSVNTQGFGLKVNF